jgi:membrane protein YqaA with SNARE-associated domain
MTAVLSAFAVALLSAFVPVTPVEPYLVALAAAGGKPVVAAGVAAAVGQSAGKVLIFLGARATVRSGPVRRWAARRASRARPGRAKGRLRRLTALLDRPALVAPIVFLSAVTGVPPLLAVSVHAARTRVSAPVFTLCCLIGRTIRFLAVISIPTLLSHDSPAG